MELTVLNESFGAALREWRNKRRLSQLQLAENVGVSSRHISFLETGKSEPSREMVLCLGEYLDVPKREINRMLIVSGHAQVFRDHISDGSSLTYVNHALDKLLEDHLPYPALVIDREWDVVKLNVAASKLLTEIGFVASKNLIECFLHDDPSRSRIVNWGETASVILKRLRYEIDILGGSNRLVQLESKLRSYIKRNDTPVSVDYSQNSMNIKFQLGDVRLSYFSLISQLGAVLDVTASEYKVELMFPADDCTKQYHLESL